MPPHIVPSVSIQHGDAFDPALKGEAAEFYKSYNEKYYHQVSDEYHDWWDIGAMVQEADLVLAIGGSQMPRYKDSDEFSAADTARFRK